MGGFGAACLEAFERGGLLPGLWVKRLGPARRLHPQQRRHAHRAHGTLSDPGAASPIKGPPGPVAT